MSGASNDLAVHLAKSIMVNPDLAYLIGPGSRTWELLMDALASITQESPSAVHARKYIELTRVNGRRPRLPAFDDLLVVLSELADSAGDVMSALDEFGARIVPHLLDDDDNAGQRTRAAIARSLVLIAQQKPGS